MDRAKVSQLFKKQIPPGQHNCNERDMTKNMKSLNLVPSQTVMSSEELGCHSLASVHIAVAMHRVQHPILYLTRLC